MTQDAELNIAPFLDSGEPVLWSGVPKQGFLLRPADWLFIPFSLMWGGFAVFWEAAVLVSGAPPLFVIWGIPFVAIGVYMIAGRFVVDRRIRARTFYAVTNRRLIVLSGFSRPQIKSINLRALADITLNERSDEWGTITLGQSQVWGPLPAGWPGAGQLQAPQFELIRDARSVYNIIRAAQQAAA